MIQTVKKMYLSFASILQNERWNREVLRIRKEISPAPLASLPAGKKIILIPHPDDEWVGCSQVVENAADDVLLCYMNMHGGDDVATHDKRIQELQRLADSNQRMLVIAEGDKSVFLKELICQTKPQMLFIPFFMDWHIEHVQVMLFLCTAINMLLEDEQPLNLDVAMYQVSVPIPENYITHAVPLSRKEWMQKWQLFEKVYRTQLGIPYKRFACCERINGKLCNSYAAESYVVQSCKQWADNLDSMLLDAQQRDTVNRNLSSIICTRSLLRDYQRKEK